jgi:hypothetical protein
MVAKNRNARIVRVGAAQEGIEQVIVRHNLRQMDRSTEDDRIAHGDQQGVEKVVGSLGAGGLPKRPIPRQRWRPEPQPHAETEYGKQQDRNNHGPMDCDERQKFGLQRQDHPDADKQQWREPWPPSTNATSVAAEWLAILVGAPALPRTINGAAGACCAAGFRSHRCLLWVTFRPNRRLDRRPPIGPVPLHELMFCIVHLAAAQISKKHPPKRFRAFGGASLKTREELLEAMRIANLLPSDPLTSGRTIASGHPLRLRVTDLIRNARLRRGGIDRCGQEDGKKRKGQAHV